MNTLLVLFLGLLARYTCAVEAAGTTEAEIITETTDVHCEAPPWSANFSDGNAIFIHWEGVPSHFEVEISLQRGPARTPFKEKCISRKTITPLPGSKPNMQLEVGIGSRKLCHNAAYTMNVTLYCEKKSVDSMSFEVWTTPDIPTNFKMNSVNSSSFNIIWDPLPGAEVNYTVMADGTTYSVDGTSIVFSKLKPKTVYAVKISAANKRHTGNYSDTLYAETDYPPIPGNLRVENRTSSSVELLWDAPFTKSVPETYRVQYWSAEHDKTMVKNKLSAGTVAQIDGLAPYAEYEAHVCPMYSDGDGEWSKSIKFSTLAGVPDPPILSHWTTTNTSIWIQWEEPFPYQGPIEYYTVHWIATGQHSSGIMKNTTTTEMDIEPLTPMTHYDIRMSATTESGTGSWSNTLTVFTDIGVPTVPEDIGIRDVSNTSIVVTWNYPHFYHDYIIESVVQLTQEEDDVTVTSPTSSTILTIRNLEAYTNYSIRICVCSQTGCGEWSDKLFTRTNIGIPDAPVEIVATNVTTSSILVKWREPIRDRGPVNYYIVQWSSDGDKAESVSKRTFYLIEHLTPYRNFSIQVHGTTDAGPGNRSEPIYVRTIIGVPNIPQNFRGVGTDSNSVRLAWDEPQPSTGPVIRYTVEWTRLIDGASRNSYSENLSYTATGLDSFTNYTFRVCASTEDGMGNWTDTIVVRTDTGVPSPPTNFRFSKLTDTSIELSWDEPEPVVGIIVNYFLQWFALGGDSEWNLKGSVSTAELSYEIRDLETYTNYSFKVSAATEAGNGSWTEELTIRTNSGVPSAPEELRVKSATDHSITIEWNEPTTFRGPVIAYKVRWTELPVEDSEESSSVSSLEFIIGKLKPYMVYRIEVSAQTEAGYGPWSESIQKRTEEGTPSAPREIVVVNKTSMSIHWKWLPPEPFTGPILEYSLDKGCRKEIDSPSCNGTYGTTITTVPYFLAKDLIPYTNYYIIIRARTRAGWGPSSDKVWTRTIVDIPSKPLNLKAVKITSTTIRVEWSVPEFPNGPQLTYTVKWHRRSEEDKHRTALIPVQLITRLLPVTEYVVTVAAENTAGHGPSNEVFATTKVAAPPPPKILSVGTLTSESAFVEWRSPDPYPGPTNYSIEVLQWPDACKLDSDWTQSKTLDRGPKNGPDKWLVTQRDIIQHLLPYTNYTFRVFLKTSEGTNTSSTSDIVQTHYGVPDAPSELQIDCSSSSTQAHLRWKPPLQTKAKIVEYLVKCIDESSSKMVDVFVPVSEPCSPQQTIVAGLRPELSYLVIVQARAENASEEGTPVLKKGSCILPAGIPTLDDVESLIIKPSRSSPHQLVLEWDRKLFSDYMGELVNFAVLVGKPDAVGNATNGTLPVSFPSWENYTAGFSEEYQATPEKWNPFDRNLADPLHCVDPDEDSMKRLRLHCHLGLEEFCAQNATTCNGALEPNSLYGLKLRAFTRRGFVETDPIFVKTEPVSTSGLVGAVIGSLFALLIVGGAIGSSLYLKRKGKLHPITQAFLMRLGKPSSAHNSSSMQMEPVLREETEEKISRPLSICNFIDHVMFMMSDSHLRFSEEFERLKGESPKHSCTAAEIPENKMKNRWQNIFPYDHSRVKLLPLADDINTDFINANYIPGFYSQREYIATQGPLPQTVDDFWRMVWEQRATVLVMLTQCVERAKTKCEQYWPDFGASRTYGDLVVSTLDQYEFSSYVIRTLVLRLGTQDRRIHQMHFTRWPDFGCPESSQELINFVRAVRDRVPRNRPGPILVHCSAGVGRTGTFIAVDRIAQQLEQQPDLTLEVYETVLDMRQHRVNMVQTEDQYIYIHLCIKQLVEEMMNIPVEKSQEVIYSNFGATKDTGV